MNIKEVNLFDYANYRAFLAEYQKKRQQKEKSFSKSEFCRQLGLPNTRSFFQDVLNNKAISKNFVERFVQVMGLDVYEAQFFRVLVQFNQSTNEEERELLFDQLISLNRTPKSFVDKKSYAYYKKWYHSAIFSLVDVIEIKDDYKALAKKLYPTITTKQARDSIKLMSDLGLIEKDEEGVWRATDRAITAGPYVRNELVKQYQLQCLDLAKQIMLNQLKKPHNISTMTVSISGKAYQLIEKKLQKFKSEIRSIVHKEGDPSDRVYQLNIQYFPQSQ
ncbi:MAG: TIGR02147 family protein [Fibrobacteria bacterium]|nr:TIGR02147 family protein [Fibrobacteria bacterium]